MRCSGVAGPRGASTSKSSYWSSVCAASIFTVRTASGSGELDALAGGGVLNQMCHTATLGSPSGSASIPEFWECLAAETVKHSDRVGGAGLSRPPGHRGTGRVWARRQ